MAASKKQDDVGQAEVQGIRDKAREQGYEGYSPSTIPNKEFTLTTGPDSPSAAEQMVKAAEQNLNDLKARG
jgi:hypothetical protein